MCAVSARNVVLVEVNEVPNSVLDAYARQSPFMAEFLAGSDRYTTICADQIQLDPWIAWPTFHRGVPDTVHGLLRLGQDTAQIDEAYPPVWRLLKDQGVSVGVCGSLYSSSEEDLAGYRFMVPDVFSPHANVNPDSLHRFQSFNLAMTRASARNASEGVAAGGGAAVADLALHGWLRPQTMARVAGQLVNERLDHKKLSRRRNTQTELFGDVFCALLEKERPQFSTYYTNNVAAAMHRFWSASFRDSSINEARLRADWMDAYSDEVFAAMRSVERVLRRILAVMGDDTTVVVASAIGQEEIPAENHAKFATIVDPDAFIAGLLGHEEIGAYRLLPAMVPDFTIRFDDPQDADLVCERLGTFAVGENAAIETLERMNTKELVGADTGMPHIRYGYTKTDFKFPITFARSDRVTVHVSLQIDDYLGPAEARLGNRSVPFRDIGLGLISHDEGVNCTAQHCAEGSLTVRRPGGARAQALKVVSSVDFVPSLLKHFSVAGPSHLLGEASIEF
jgi:hypothetical protein